MDQILTIAATVSGLAGVALFSWAFVQIGRVGWQSALQSQPDGSWSRPRRLLLAGGVLTLVRIVLQTVSVSVARGGEWSRVLSESCSDVRSLSNSTIRGRES